MRGQSAEGQTSDADVDRKIVYFGHAIALAALKRLINLSSQDKRVPYGALRIA